MKTFTANSCILFLVTLLFTGILFAQATVIKLPTTVGTSSSLTISDSNNTTLMKLNADGGFYILGNTTTGIIPATGVGSRLMWHPAKRAFRAGRVTGTQWDLANVGDYSIAAGYNPIASAYYTTSMGYNTTASANGATALGYTTTASNTGSTALGYYANASGNSSTSTGYQTAASGNYSTAMGHFASAKGISSMAVGDSCSADGDYSIAMGRNAIASSFASISMGDHTTANGNSCVALGYYTTASGFASVAMGDPTVASGYTAVAIGHEVTADADYSIALGNFATTNSHKGSFIFGDASSEERVASSEDQQMTMRFAGGYRLFTEPTGKYGAFLPANGNEWLKESDSTKKELFAQVNNENFLVSLSKLKLVSWNYKGQNPKQYRHYGPMAQEIFHYFGKDEYGTIGNDTTLAAGDMDGIMMICLQALEKRTKELKTAVSELQKANEKIVLVEKNNSEMQKRIEKIEQLITSTPPNNAQGSTSSK
jgi:hypothetical protein